MGEWSKKIGEYGESVVERFLSVIGWSDLAKGIQIDCSQQNGEHLNSKGEPARTHGIDFLYSYMNPLVDGQLNNIVISSKYSNDKYPNSPQSTFKKYMLDLINTIECFDCSPQKDSIIPNFHPTTINDVGVLFWLNNSEDGYDDLINAVSTVRIDSFKNNTIYIMDNKRVGFILEVMSYIKSKTEYNYFFYYPATGQNLNPQNRNNTGSILPVEYLNSSIIPIKLMKKSNEKEIALLLASIDNFEAADLKRLMGLAKDISSNWVGDVIIAFPDYNELLHKNIVAESKQGFQDNEFTKTVTVENYKNLLNVY